MHNNLLIYQHQLYLQVNYDITCTSPQTKNIFVNMLPNKNLLPGIIVITRLLFIFLLATEYLYIWFSILLAENKELFSKCFFANNFLCQNSLKASNHNDNKSAPNILSSKFTSKILILPLLIHQKEDCMFIYFVCQGENILLE